MPFDRLLLHQNSDGEDGQDNDARHQELFTVLYSTVTCFRQLRNSCARNVMSKVMQKNFLLFLDPHSNLKWLH